MNVLAIGTGEYTTGIVNGNQSTSDKRLGVVALTLFDLRRRGLVGSQISLAGTSGDKFPFIRDHFKTNIENVYKDMDTSFTSYPEAGVRDTQAYKRAIEGLQPGDAVTIFTPDSTHHEMAVYAMRRKLHVLVTKPAVQTLEDHKDLIKVAKEEGVLCYVEHHKRFDPVYLDARNKFRTSLGDLSFFTSYMSQPKTQLDTFKAWAGKDSDISYYLNSHHIDVLNYFVAGRAVPTRVTAAGSEGVAIQEPYNCPPGTEDTITLLTEYCILDANGAPTAKRATAVFTASWAAPRGAGVHSEQRFHLVGTQGEVTVNQARRGYTVVTDPSGGLPTNADINPFYMAYAPDMDGYFAGQSGYGYKSIEHFIRAATAINQGRRTPESFDGALPTILDTLPTAAVLHAGRISLDEHRPVDIRIRDGDWKLV